MLTLRSLTLAPLALASLLILAPTQPAAAETRVAVGVRTGNVAFGYSSGGYHGGGHDYGHSHSSFSLGINLGDPFCYRPYYYAPYGYRSYYYDPYYYAPPVYYAPAPVYYPSSVVTGPAVVTAPSYYVTPPPAPATVQSQPAPTYSTPAPPPTPAAERPVYAPQPAPAPVRLPPVAQAPASSDPWSLLANGQLEASHELFTRAVERDSLDATSKVGLALARAALGDPSGGTLWMRRAVNVDPESLRRIRIDDPLQKRLAQIAATYQQQTSESATRSDAFFMLGALDTMQGNYQHASECLRSADKSGDHHDTTKNLRRLIEHELDRDPAAK